MMCPEELVAFISSVAIAISKGLTNSQLDILAAVFTQLADTFATISVQRSNIDEILERYKQYYENNNEEDSSEEEAIIRE